MENFEYCWQTIISFGRGAENNAGTLIKRAGGQRVLIVTGRNSAKASGLSDRLRRILDRAGLEYRELSGIEPNPKLDKIYAGIQLCVEAGLDFILAVGGGAVIDSAKAIAAGACCAHDVRDFFTQDKNVAGAIPVGAVLTVPGSGSECSPGSCILIQDADGRSSKLKISSPQLVPRFAILNPEVTMTLPPLYTACGAAEIMSHVLACYFTNVQEVELTDRLCESILCTVVHMLPRVLSDPEDYEARANLMWAGTLAHNGPGTLGRTFDPLPEILEDELSAHCGCAHGAGLAVILPAWLEFVLEHNPLRTAQFAQRIFGCALNFENPHLTAANGIKALRQFFAESGLPTSFRDLKVDPIIIPELVRNLEARYPHLGVYLDADSTGYEAVYSIAASSRV